MTRTDADIPGMSGGANGLQAHATATPFSSIERGVARCLLKSFGHRVPRSMLTFLIGDPGLGKSLLTLLMAAQTTDEGGAVLLLSAEDSPSVTIRPRLEAVGADLDRVHYVSVRRDGIDEGLALPEDISELAELVRAHGVQLVVIDPLMAHLPETVNSWRDQSVRGALAPLARMAADLDPAVVVVGHLNKGRGGDALYRAGGSVGIPAAARSVLLLARDPGDTEDGSRRVLAHVKCNVGPLADSLAAEVRPVLLDGNEQVKTARLAIVGNSTVASSDLLAPLHGEERSERDEAADFLLDLLPCPAKNVKSAAAAAGLSMRTVERAKAMLGVRSVKSGLGGGWEWQLPEDRQGQDRHTQDRQPHISGVAVFDSRAKNIPIGGGLDDEDRHAVDMAAFGGVEANGHDAEDVERAERLAAEFSDGATRE